MGHLVPISIAHRLRHHTFGIFDQFILSAELAGSFQRGDVAVLESAAGEPLLSLRGIPNGAYSDHLPLFAVVRVEDFADGNEEPVGGTCQKNRR